MLLSKMNCNLFLAALLLPVTVVVAVAATERVHLKNLIRELEQKTEVSSSSSYEDMSFATKFYANQTLDHTAPFSPSRPTWSHRYLVNDTYFGTTPLSEDCPGPIFLYMGGESDIVHYAGSYNGFMKYLTAKYGGLMLLFEERYYGESVPTEGYTYLTTQQVLEDAVQLLPIVKTEYGAQNCPTIAFGGSYAGTLAAFLRSAYPFAVQGALSSSAEFGYYDLAGWEERGIDKMTFSEIIGKEYAKTDGCLQAIWDATDLMHETDDADLIQTFNLCDASALKPVKSSLFTYDLEGLVQGNYPYAIGSYPAWPVEHACQIMLDTALPLLERAAQVLFMIEGTSTDGKCIPTPDSGPGNIPGDGPGPGSWGYQSCTETLHEFSSTGRGGTGVRYFTYEEEAGPLIETQCMDRNGVVPDQNVLTMRYGGFDIAQTTSNTIFSMGTIDPWGGAAILSTDGGPDASSRGVHFFELEDAAHHLDLRGWNEADPAQVTAARREEEAIIMGWVREYVGGSSPDTSSSCARYGNYHICLMLCSMLLFVFAVL